MGKRNRNKRTYKKEPSNAKKQFDKLSNKEKQYLGGVRGDAIRENRKHVSDAYTESIGRKFDKQLNADAYSGYKSNRLSVEHVHGIKWPRAYKKQKLRDSTHTIHQKLNGRWSY